MLSLPPLYPLVDVDLCRARGVEPLALLAALLEGGATFIQLRDKTPSSGAALALADAAVALTRAAGARLIVNDRPDIARLSGADGVHVGQDDLPVEETRAIVGPGAIVGVSTHDEGQIAAAAGTSATYVAVGPVYGTATKDTGYTARGLDLLRHAALRLRPGPASAGKPVVAIGGITLERAPEVLAAGAASVAVISDLLTGGDPASRTRAFLDRLSARRV
jgi:thiamine-phosphate pyrophosphorylase